MAAVKLTKNELRNQQNRLNQLLRYLPTLQLKKALLQAEVMETRHEIERLQQDFDARLTETESFSGLFTQKISIDLKDCIKIKEIAKRYENIAGVDVPIFENVTFFDLTYDLFDTPVWLDAAIEILRRLSRVKAEIIVCEEKKRALEHELREVSIRVNLFEKILIPRSQGNIKKIKIFLGDQQLAAVSQAKVAKAKILHRDQNRDQEYRDQAYMGIAIT